MTAPKANDADHDIFSGFGQSQRMLN